MGLIFVVSILTRKQDVLPVLFSVRNNFVVRFRGSVFKKSESKISAGVFDAVLLDNASQFIGESVASSDVTCPS